MFAQRLSAAPNADPSVLLSALFESLPEALLICDSRLLVLSVNKAASDLMRRPAGDLKGLRADEVLPSQPPQDLMNASRRNARLEWQTRFERQGRPYELAITATGLVSSVAGPAGWLLALRPRGHAHDIPEFVGDDPVTQELLEFVSRIARSRATSILLRGESGTGKELIARRLHAMSHRASEPFVPINCAALPESLCESELFGYEKGAFTNAVQPSEGLFGFADGGTVFLDEIGELPLALQAKLLRVLEDHSFRRVGGERSISADIRIISATNTDLEKAMAERRFRTDLYYRLNAVQIALPSLRERVGDIPRLAQHFVTHFSAVHQRNVHGIHPGALRKLQLYGWPGNVRELRNVMERAVLVETTSLVTPSSLALPNRTARGMPASVAATAADPCTPFSLSGSEKELIAAALDETRGNQTRAAQLLGIGRFSLRYKMKKLSLL